MHRRHFLASAALGAASAATSQVYSAPAASESQAAARSGDAPRFDVRRKAWLFWDLWHMVHADNVELCLGQATWQREATFAHPTIRNLASWPTVFWHDESRRWRMYYSQYFSPLSLHVAESDDGLHFEPLAIERSPQTTAEPPAVSPKGASSIEASNHLFTLQSGSGGGVYIDPVAADGYRYKIYAHQKGRPVLERALADERNPWHKIATAEGLKPYFAEECVIVSRDGINWTWRFDLAWSLRDWHPEPPVYGYYNRMQKRHMMTVRPGWGDRRVCLQSTDDFTHWSGPELLFQPDAADGLDEHYGMPVFPYEDQYVGLLWIFHCATSARSDKFNRSLGTLDCQLAYSFDGRNFSRGPRQPLVAINPSDEHGGGAVQPSSMVATDREIRIYSASSRVQHGEDSFVRRTGMKDAYAVLLHTLRRDGFMYLKSRGGWATFTSKPLVLFAAPLSINAKATVGEVYCQLQNLAGEPIAGCTFDDFDALVARDELDVALTWRGRPVPAAALGRAIRLEVRFRHAELFAIRGNFHFLDAQDSFMAEDGKAIDPRLFDF